MSFNANNKSLRSRSSFESRSRTSFESSFETFPARVSFQIGGIINGKGGGGGVDIDEEDERPAEEKENFVRRGSAPSHLLLSQVSSRAKDQRSKPLVPVVIVPLIYCHIFGPLYDTLNTCKFTQLLPLL